MVSKMKWSGLTIAAISLAVGGVGCSGTPQHTGLAASSAPAKPAAPPKAHEVHERITAHTCPARAKVAALLGHTDPKPKPPGADQPEATEPPPTSAGTNKLASNEAYRTVAPGVVLVRTDHAFGTGVVIDPKGYILTNHHVVAEGRRKDFVISVNVTFGDLTPTGRMVRQEKSYDAVVVKDDPIRDLALVKVTDVPPKLTSVKLAKSAPQIGEKVMAIGHAGIGFLWAAKACSIASVGERQQDSSRIAGFDCPPPDPTLSADEIERYKKSCDARKKDITEALAATTQGIAIQTDCAITHGDSGGPLINAAGELVGLNQSISADMATASFHVHLDEISDFVAKHADEGIAILPDPLCDGGSETTLEDVDLDGVPDTLLSKPSYSGFYGYEHMSLLIDIDESHLAKKTGDSEWTPNDTPIALLSTNEGIFVWYDTDGDGRYDLLLHDKDSDGRPEAAYRIKENGALVLDNTMLPHHDLSHRYLKSKTLEPRLAKIAMAVGGSRWVSDITLAEGKTSNELPDPVLGGGNTGHVIDTKGDGKPDTALVRGTFSSGVLIDIDDTSISSLKSGDPVDDVLKTKQLHPKVSIITQGRRVVARYDLDNDGRFDIALVDDEAGNGAPLVATSAWKLGAGDPTPLPDQIGRRILRPGLMAAMRSGPSAFHMAGGDVAKDEGMGSLPDPTELAWGSVHPRVVKGVPDDTVVDADHSWTSVVLVDVDHDTKLPLKPKDSDVERAVHEGKFDAEIALIRQLRPTGVASDWIYYDTDNDGKFDLVLFAPEVGKDPSLAYRVGADGKLAVDNDAVKGKPFRYSVFKDKLLAGKAKQILPKVFGTGSVEE